MRILGITLAACIISGSLPLVVALAQQATPPPAQRPAAAPAAQDQPTRTTVTPSRQQWGAAIARRPLPKKGCFTASYPEIEWKEVACARPSHYPNPPSKPPLVGNRNDFMAAAPVLSLISSATGSFKTVTGVTSENGAVGGGGQPSPNVFTLQLNSQVLDPPCSSIGNSWCQGWEQFVFSQTQCVPDAAHPQSVVPGTAPCVFIEYWMLYFGHPCPPGWNASGTADCWFNTLGSYVLPQTIADLSGLVLTATTSSTQDEVKLVTPSGQASAVGHDSVVNLSQFWNEAEFNIFGDCCDSEAVFNDGSTIVVNTSITTGNMDAPVCVNFSPTAETNSLNLVQPCCAIPGQSSAQPAIVFTESNVASATSLCACPLGATWNPTSGNCVCNGSGQVVVNGKCVVPKNVCGGTTPLGNILGASCGQNCGRWSCDGPNKLMCFPHLNACGGCSSVPIGQGEGAQPGETCACSNGATGRYYCTASKQLFCDCQP